MADTVHDTEPLSFAASVALLTEEGALWQAARQDAGTLPPEEYVADIERQMTDFFEADTLFDRDDVVRILCHRLSKKARGELCLFLGCKSVGKSLVMRTLKQQLEDSGNFRVLVVDGRYHSDLKAGLLDALQSTTSVTEYARSLVSTGFGAVASMGSRLAAAAQAVLDAPELSRSSELHKLLELYCDSCKRDKRFPVLLLDEANRMLSSADKQGTLDALSVLTKATKERSFCHVVMAASEHAEPYRLQDIGFATSHITCTVVAGEVPLIDMRRLLKEHWGVGSRLTKALEAVCGGHVWNTQLCITALAEAKEGYAAYDMFNGATLDSVKKCMTAEQQNPEKWAGLTDMLRQMAQQGYAPLDNRVSDARAQLISETNVGAVLSRSCLPRNISREDWRAAGTDFIVVPSSHSIRLLLAHKLAALH